MKAEVGTTLIAEVTEATVDETGARSQVQFAHGEIGEIHDRRYRLETERGPVLAQRAVSCLVEPQAGDRVLFVVEGEGRGTILHILSRPNPAEKPVTISTPDGALRLGGTSIVIQAEEDVAIAGGALSFTAETADLMAQTTTLAGESLRQIYGRTQINTRSLEQMAERVVTKAVDRVEIVDNVDNQVIGTLSVKVSGVMTQSAYSTVLVAAEDLRLDGKRVTVG